MIVPFVLLGMSSVTLWASLTLPGVSGFEVIAGPLVLASILLLLRAARANHRPGNPKPNWIVVDGSNVMHWNGNEPRAETLREVLNILSDRGFTPGVVFDANVGHKLSGRFLNERALSKLFGLPRDRVMVADSGTQADPIVLESARFFGCSIVSNDRFRDYAEQHPEIADPGHLISGGYRNGEVWLRGV